MAYKNRLCLRNLLLSIVALLSIETWYVITAATVDAQTISVGHSVATPSGPRRAVGAESKRGRADSAAMTMVQPIIIRGQSPLPGAVPLFTPPGQPLVMLASATQVAQQPTGQPYGEGVITGDPFAALGAVTGGPVVPQAIDPFATAPGYWNPYLAGIFSGNEERIFGQAQVMMPLYQDGYNLLFGDVRGLIDDNDGSEGNLGVGWRSIVDPFWILGAYAFYDLKETGHGNNFNQVSFGVEAISVSAEARINGYIPESKSAPAPGATALNVVGGNVLMRAGVERAYYGLDGEVGVLLADHHGGQSELRGFAGGFWFDTDAAGFRDIAGPKLRLELRNYDLFGSDSRLTFGVEYRWDEVRESVVTGLVRVQVPLGGHPTTPNSRLQRRMLDRVIRDDDIITMTEAAGPPELAVDDLTGTVLTNVTIVDASTMDVPLNVMMAGPNSIVIADGRRGPIDLTSSIALNTNQMLLGGGFRVRGQSSGTRAVFGRRPTLNGSDSAQDVVTLDNMTTVRGLNIRGGRNGILGDGVDRFTIIDNDISGAMGGDPHGNGILLLGMNGQGGSVSANTTNRNSRDGISIVGTEFVGDLSNNTANGNGLVTPGFGMVVDANVTGNVTGNTADENALAGILVSGDVTGNLSGNSASANAGAGGIGVFGKVGGNVDGNSVHGNALQGLFIADGVDGTLSRNTANGNRTAGTPSEGAGIEVRGGIGGNVSENVARDNFEEGMILQAVSGQTVMMSDNIFSGNNGSTMREFLGLGDGAGAVEEFQLRNNVSSNSVLAPRFNYEFGNGASAIDVDMSNTGTIGQAP